MSFRLAKALAFAGLAATAAPIPMARLTPESLAGWDKYIAATDVRMSRELSDRTRFLASDFEADGRTRRATIAAGTILVDQVNTLGPNGADIEVPLAMIHHWRGEVLIPGVRLNELMTKLLAGPPGAKQQEDVLESRILERGPDRLKIYLKVQRTKFVTVVYNTEHEVRFSRQGAIRATSTSRATKIAELENPGTASERELPQGDDSGYMWRWNSYWRYEEVQGGVIAECESVSLSRDVPSVLRYLAGPLIRSTARESMERTLTALRDRYRR
jgi:hypothetical protein